jgi:hypothetical protein
MSEVSLIVRTADQSRKAEIAVSSENTVGDIVHSAIENWALPSDADYTVVNVTRGKSLNPTDPIARAGIQPGDVLELQPVLVAG